ncbi:MAG: hypothetical protein PF505_05235 [Vallitaleaceae bacterium]|jgi:DNA mismatch repair protein MutS|nr:hypothetical protein [Vallitaleaceae bacterium]
MAFNSLLWLETSTYQELDEQVIGDLGLHGFYKKLTDLSQVNLSVINRLCTDMDTITYRQAIIRDLMAEPALTNYLVENLEAFCTLVYQFTKTTYEADNFYFLVELVKIVEKSIQCLEDLRGTLRGYNFTSVGLKKLYESVEASINEPNFKEMKVDLKAIRYAFSQIKSAEISINMDLGMRPVEAQVTNLFDHRCIYPKAFRKVAMVIQDNGTFLGKHINQYIPVFSVKNLDLDLKEELEFGLKAYHGVLKTFLNKYKKIDPLPFVTLFEEVTFYQSSVTLLQQMAKAHLPMSLPTLLPSRDRCFDVKGVYNINLAERISHDNIVLNQFKMDDDGRIFILTGANSGGKTTFTQAIGQVQLLAQLGLMVPATWARISLVNGIYTHFPVLEADTIDLGRLGKECLNFSVLFKKADRYSLILLNESFTSTSHLESLTIAGEVIKAAKTKEVRLIYNTHLHELVDQVIGFNEAIVNETPIVSITSGSQNDTNSYTIEVGPPQGISHAMKIAENFGITYKQLSKRLEAVNDV